MVHFFQFILRHTGRHHARSRTIRQRIILTKECPYHYRMVTAFIKANVTDRAAIKAPCIFFNFIYKLHGLVFRRSAQRTRREYRSHNFKRICFPGNAPLHFTHHVYHVRIILHFFKLRNLYIIANPAQIISSQIYQHNMFCIFFFVVL